MSLRVTAAGMGPNHATPPLRERRPLLAPKAEPQSWVGGDPTAPYNSAEGKDDLASASANELAAPCLTPSEGRTTSGAPQLVTPPPQLTPPHLTSPHLLVANIPRGRTSRLASLLLLHPRARPRTVTIAQPGPHPSTHRANTPRHMHYRAPLA